jgi:hypothetical protein
MIDQAIPSRFLGFMTVVRAAALIAVCVAMPIATLAQEPAVATPTSAAKVSLAGLDLATSQGIAAARTISQRGETGYGTSVMVVSIADLDVLSPQNVLIAHERIHNTARRICGQLTSIQDPASIMLNA